MNPSLPAGWTLSASAFNWTSSAVRAERSATDIAVDIVSTGVAPVIEVELGQLWRSFPLTSDAEAEGLRDALAAVGGRVSIVGASIDDWDLPARRRTDAERFTFLLPQLRAAHRLGATGVRLPIGQAGPGLTNRLLPHLHELDLVLFEEAQGRQTPAADPAVYDAIAAIDDPHVRVLIDISMLMRALPPSYLERLAAAGVPPELMTQLTDAWRDPATHDAVMALLRGGGVPGPIHTLYMNLLVRFGRSDVRELRDVLPFVGAFHLKFWDLDDADGRVSAPIHDLGAELANSDFTGTFTSEWGGLEWLDDDAAVMTRAHMALAGSALSEGAASSRRGEVALSPCGCSTATGGSGVRPDDPAPRA
ncbi:restriction endonuclease subunit R [Microbacterium sp. 22215]|uniref:restriction endonuclease subunit R n=1 Tax=Microbacterium sp. 22215 TaxID=3453893 RepID=UPI003F872FA1